MISVAIPIALGFLTASASATGWALQHTGHRGANVAASVAQITDTLGNLLKSLQDEGTEAQSLFHSRHRWCSAGLRARIKEQKAGEVSLTQLMVELKAREKVVKEAEVTVALARTEIAKDREYLDRAAQKDFHNATAADVSAKRQNLAALQAALQGALPNLAQLQEGALETKQRLASRSASVASTQDFIAALKEDCAQGKLRGEAQETARAGELSAIQTAFQVLEDLTPGLQGKEASAGDSSDQDASQDISFVQVQMRSDGSHLSALLADEDVMEKQQVTQAAEHAKPATVYASDTKIEKLLAQLKQEQNEESEQRTWCSVERQRNQLVQQHAKDSLTQLQNEIKMHTEAESQLSKDIGILQKEVKALDATAKWATASATREENMLRSVSKDHRLAARILGQATAILLDMEHSGGLRGRMKRDASTAAAALNSAKSTFEGQSQDAMKADAATRTAEAAKATSQARAHEIDGLELSRDRHDSERVRGREDEGASQEEVNEATAYLEKLESECKSDIYVQRVRERTAQIRALQDAQDVLGGKQVEANEGPLKVANRVQNPNMSPMERAAAEMHVAMDDN